MKKIVKTWLGFLLLFQIGLAAQAQDYLPFEDGKIYHFMASDSIYSLSISTHPNGTSYFNRMVKRGVVRTGNATCIGTPTTFHEQANNQFGEKMVELPGGEYKFLVLSGTTFPLQQEEFLLKTRIPIGHTWTMNGPANLVATLASRTTANLGSVTDSVLIYTLNKGGQLILSKAHGFLQAPNFTAYVAGSGFPKRQLFQYKLPDPWNANSLNSPLKVFDFQPNDQFSYYKWENSSLYACYQEWIQYKVLTRTTSQNGSVIDYTIEKRRLIGTTPIGTTSPCTTNVTFTQMPPVINNLSISANTYPELSLLTNGFLPGYNLFQTPNRAMVSTRIQRESNYHQREVFYVSNLEHLSPSGFPSGVICSNSFYYTPDMERYVAYATGLDKVGEFSINMWPNIATETLEAYIKGSETYGTFQTFAQIMGVEKEIGPASFSAFPNPFTSELNLKLSSTFKGENATVSILNTLGQEIFKTDLSATPNQEMKLTLPEMAKGVYVLRVTENGKTHTSRLVKE